MFLYPLNIYTQIVEQHRETFINIFLRMDLCLSTLLEILVNIFFRNLAINLPKKIGYFEPDGTYIKVYPKSAFSPLFAECGFTVRAIETCTLGKGNHGRVNRFVVIAERA
jgi:hypothetical protein